MLNFNLINTTPNLIRVIDINNNILVEIPPSGYILTLEEISTDCGELNGIPVVMKRTSVNNALLVNKASNYIFITTADVARELKRPDVVAPNSSMSIIDGIITCTGFAVYL